LLRVIDAEGDLDAVTRRLAQALGVPALRTAAKPKRAVAKKAKRVAPRKRPAARKKAKASPKPKRKRVAVRKAAARPARSRARKKGTGRRR
jgi:hypothetical protein